MAPAARTASSAARAAGAAVLKRRSPRDAGAPIALPFVRELLETVQAAEIARVGEREIERREHAASQLDTLGDPKMRRPQQRQDDRAGEVGCDGFERDIEGGRIRLGRQRQRVQRFERHTSAAKHVACEIEIRKWPPDDESGAVQRHRLRRRVRRAFSAWSPRFSRARSGPFQPPRNPGKLLLAIAIAEREWRRAAARLADGARRRIGERVAAFPWPLFLESGSTPWSALEQTGAEHGFRGDDIDRSSSGSLVSSS